MPHVTFIHGIANKPAVDTLLSVWLNALAEDTGLDAGLHLGDAGVTSSMVYWADLFYPGPLTDPASFEAQTDAGDARAELLAAEPVDMPKPATSEETRFLRGLLKKTPTPTWLEELEPGYTAISEVQRLERVPLPWGLKKLFLQTYLRDVHHYLFDAAFAPSAAATAVPIQQTIRARFLTALAKVPKGGPHVVVSHSMGTVIAYDCLMRVDACPTIDALMTLGSPLGVDEIQDRLRPEHTRHAGFPRGRVISEWTNVADRLDPVCGFDPFLANDFQENCERQVHDVEVENPGAWRHSATKYLRQASVRSALRRMLKLKPA